MSSFPDGDVTLYKSIPALDDTTEDSDSDIGEGDEEGGGIALLHSHPSASGSSSRWRDFLRSDEGSWVEVREIVIEVCHNDPLSGNHILTAVINVRLHLLYCSRLWVYYLRASFLIMFQLVDSLVFLSHKTRY